MRCCRPTRYSPAWAEQAGSLHNPAGVSSVLQHAKNVGIRLGVPEKLLHIDIPVTLTKVKTVFSIEALVFGGDLPASIFHLQLIGNDIGD